VSLLLPALSAHACAACGVSVAGDAAALALPPCGHALHAACALAWARAATGLCPADGRVVFCIGPARKTARAAAHAAADAPGTQSVLPAAELDDLLAVAGRGIGAAGPGSSPARPTGRPPGSAGPSSAPLRRLLVSRPPSQPGTVEPAAALCVAATGSAAGPLPVRAAPQHGRPPVLPRPLQRPASRDDARGPLVLGGLRPLAAESPAGGTRPPARLRRGLSLPRMAGASAPGAGAALEVGASGVVLTAAVRGRGR
jgi:hypothetical protein